MPENYNPFVDKFLTIYSQSEFSTSGTRGYDPVTYVDTKLDRELIPRIMSPETRLVVLTGNAGDGKTAFIQRVEAMAEENGAKFLSQTDNGCTFEIEGKAYQTLYDGSQDFEGTSNDQILKEFFSDFEGKAEPEGDFTKVIAINEGKLRDFVLFKREYSWFGKQVHHYLERDNFTPHESLVFINLNLRSIVSKSKDEPSIFDLVLDKFLDLDNSLGFWDACSPENCEYSSKCYIRYNIEAFRHETLGSEIRNRLKHIIHAVMFRKTRHITMRDIRSILSFILINKYSCKQIQADLENDELTFDRYYYNALFSKQEKDRLGQTINELDVARTSHPKLDNFIHFHEPEDESLKKLFMLGPLDRQDLPDLKSLYANFPQGTDDNDPVRQENANNYHRSIRRKLFFEGSSEDLESAGFLLWLDFLPYQKFNSFMGTIRDRKDKHHDLRDNLTLAISKSERIYNETIGRENLCLRSTSSAQSTTKGFYSFPASDFDVVIKGIGFQEQFLEYTPNALYYRFVRAGSDPSQPLELEIPIDLFEVLCRIREGYVPSASEVRTFVLNLEMFKRRISSRRPDKIFLTEDDTTLFEISRDPSNNIKMTKVGG